MAVHMTLTFGGYSCADETTAASVSIVSIFMSGMLPVLNSVPASTPHIPQRAVVLVCSHCHTQGMREIACSTLPCLTQGLAAQLRWHQGQHPPCP